MKASPRRVSRELALQGVYQWIYTGATASQVLKNLSELEQTVDGQPRFYLECARCKEQRDWNDDEALRAVRKPAS